LIGPNGAGKTTLVEMIEGIQKPDSGSITINGLTWKGNQHQLNRVLGISLQETNFVEKLTVSETLQLFASFYKLTENRVGDVLAMVRLQEKEKAYVKNLSGGQRQRLALGIALLNQPQILLLDEPTTGLDPNARREIWEILLRLKNQHQTSMILTTHYMEEAEYLCDQILIVDEGKVLARGTLQELLDNCDVNEIIEVAFSSNPPFGLEALPGLKNLSREGAENTFRLEVDKIVETLPVLLELAKNTHTEILSLQSRTMTLDDLFTSMTGRRLIA